MKDPLTPAGIEPATFRIVAQHLHDCATAVPHSSAVQWLIFSTNVWTPTLQTAPGCKDSINNGTKTQQPRQETNPEGKLIRPLQHNNRNKQRSLPDSTVHSPTR